MAENRANLLETLADVDDEFAEASDVKGSMIQRDTM